MKLLALLTHSSKESTHGVDFARVVQPMSHLKGKYKDLKVTIKVSPFTKKLTSWDEVTKYYDAIYFSYTTNDIGFVNMAFFARKNGCRLIIDCDDNLWEIPRGSEAYKVFNPDSVLLATATDIMRECDYLTTTNRYLANRMAKVCIKIGQILKFSRIILILTFITKKSVHLGCLKRSIFTFMALIPT